MNLPRPDWAYWLPLAVWSLEEAVWLTLGHQPMPRELVGISNIQERHQFVRLCRGVTDAIDIGELIPVQTPTGQYAGDKQPPRFLPSDFVAWAITKDITLPSELLALNEAPSNEETKTESKVGKQEGSLVCLPHPPKTQDEWFSAVRDMTQAFYAEHGRCPNKTEAWQRLWNNPPGQYGIIPSEDRGEKSLDMGGSHLAHSAFNKRWQRYTKIKS